MMSILTFMSILDSKLAIGKDCEEVNGIENNVFANSLIGTTIQDSGKRERSNVTICNSHAIF